MPENLSVGIAGSGTMGTGIAFTFASKGCDVTLYDTSSKAIDNSTNVLGNIISTRISKGKITPEEAEKVLEKTGYSYDLSSLDKCDIICEAIDEDLQSKQSLFASLEEYVSANTILATNTSSLSITSIASVCKYPERVIGIHFFNPAYIMPLTEVIPGLRTSGDTTRYASDILKQINKEIVIANDTPGFIVNRVARPYYGEALRILEEGIADIVTIDWAMKEFGRFKMGPFELMDLIGIDINYAVTQSIFKDLYYDPRYKPSIIQKRYVDAKLLGKKTGRGFYDYSSNESNAASNINYKLGENIFNRILVMLINEAIEALSFNVASIKDIDLAVTKGVNYPKGLLKWADELGLHNVLNMLYSLYDEYQEDRYRPSPLLKRMVKDNKTFYLNTD